MTSIAALLRRLPPRALVGCGLLVGTLPVLTGSGAASEPAGDRAPHTARQVVAAADAGDLGWLDRLDLARLRRAAAGRVPATTGLPADPQLPGPTGTPSTTAHTTAAVPPRISVGGIPPVVLAAYRAASASLARTDPNCHLDWPLLAGIGRVESHHAASGGSGRAGWDGDARPPILGPVLDGSAGTAAITDTDGGRLDGNARWDRAVGPMQFLPGTWRLDGRDGNGDGRKDPENIFDAALAAGGYLCAANGDLRKPDALAAAVFSYNHSLSYVRLVLTLADAYAHGGTGFVTLPAATASPPATPSLSPSGPGLPPSPRPSPTTTSPKPSPTGATGTPSPSPSSSPAPSSPTPSSPAPPSPSPTSPTPSPGTPTPSPTGSTPSGPVRTVTVGSGDALRIDPVTVASGVPHRPPAGAVGWWTASTVPAGAGTTILLAPAGTAAEPGPLDPRSLPLSTGVTVRAGNATVTYRVTGSATSASLPAPRGPRQLLLVSWADPAAGTTVFTIVRATPVG